MLDGLSDIGGNALAKVLRRTVISALIVGAAGIIIVLLPRGRTGPRSAWSSASAWRS